MKESKDNQKASKAAEKVRPEIMAHFQASLKKNRRLGELLGKS